MITLRVSSGETLRGITSHNKAKYYHTILCAMNMIERNMLGIALDMIEDGKVKEGVAMIKEMIEEGGE